MAKVIKDTPEDPIAYLIKVLKRLYSDGSTKVCNFKEQEKYINWAILYLHPPPPLLRVKEILGGGRRSLAVISGGVAMLLTLIFLFF